MVSGDRRWPALRGGVLALLSAALFGAGTPLVRFFGTGVGAFATAGLLCAGAALVGALSRRSPQCEARVVRADLPRIGAMALFGAVIGPVALAWGLQRTSGISASLMLAMEAAFTAVLAWRLYGEVIDCRFGSALLLLSAGGAVLVLVQSGGGSAQAHDDAHHDHCHDPMPAGEHSHWHRHERLRHAHPHVPDAHHRHGH